MSFISFIPSPRATPDCRICFQSYQPKEVCVSLGCGHLFHLNCWNSLNEIFQKKCMLCTSRVISKVPQHLTDWKLVVKRVMPNRRFFLTVLQLTLLAGSTILKKDRTKLICAALAIVMLAILIKLTRYLLELADAYSQLPIAITYPGQTNPNFDK